MATIKAMSVLCTVCTASECDCGAKTYRLVSSMRIKSITPTPVHPYLGDGGYATFVQSAEKAGD